MDFLKICLKKTETTKAIYISIFFYALYLTQYNLTVYDLLGIDYSFF